MTAHRLTVTVTDAGDAVTSATVSVKGHTEKTNVHRVAKIKLSGSSTTPVKVTVTAPTHRTLSNTIKL